MTTRIPVTVLTGFLGAGKTTLVNRILSEQHGKRIAVIENEFGEVGVDHELVIGADEEIFETSNGCICCTVRGDLIRILTQLRKRRERFDAILIETTGLADPGPVAQSFFIDEDLKEHFVLDAIVTLVDARHVEQQLEQSAVAREQIAFADIVLLNKTDLVDASVVGRIQLRVQGINGTATVLQTRNANVPLERVLDVGAFDLTRALSRDEDFLQPERPYEWAGHYRLNGERSILRVGSHATGHSHDELHAHQDGAHAEGHGHDAHHAGHDASRGHALRRVDMLLLPVPAGSADLDALFEAASRAFASAPLPLPPEGALPLDQLVRIALHGPARYRLAPVTGQVLLLCEHAPEEFGLSLEGTHLLQERRFGSHHHDTEISSIGLEDPRPLNPDKLNDWLSYLLQSRGQDILRMKGVLNLANEPRRYVFHGVHMVYDGQLERPWPANGARRSRLVFIGRNLDRAELEAGFESCLA